MPCDGAWSHLSASGAPVRRCRIRFFRRLPSRDQRQQGPDHRHLLRAPQSVAEGRARRRSAHRGWPGARTTLRREARCPSFSRSPRARSHPCRRTIRIGSSARPPRRSIPPWQISVVTAVIPGPERSEGARNPYSQAVVMDSGLAARSQVYAGCVNLPALAPRNDVS